ncbi:hypothetical protein DFP93_10876 [Aneurinibacillus soli]|uniref:Uncharacterized protein n=1 Tax=Aneurinibacillus soli TaxID=1500254 RepID=A0A0U5AZZ2_9BACL|nr:hypothetical protein [Aneurinibacillus soli]PYE61502.1 hypothetical protein DFP93_10876 [Aneurinibacillus soli]BAU26543.1 hypothetical protein CB4_00670 [Aneurinibacillus soli]
MNKWGYGITGAAIAFTVGLVSVGTAAPTEPGTEGDPVVTRSYVEQVRQELVKLIQAAPQQPSSPTSTGSTTSYTVEKVTAGKTITGMEGTEFIVRTGQVKAVTPGEDYTIPDLTSGTSMPDGEAVPHDHLLLIPRADGRGLTVTSGKADIIVRGDYKVQ